MTRKLGESKGVTKYLKGRYKKKYKKILKTTFDEDVKLQKDIILDHDKDELNMMLKRIEASIEVEKDTQSLYSQPFSIILVMVTVMMSASMAMVSSFMSLMNNIFGKYLDSQDIKKINFNELFDSLSSFKHVIQYVLISAAVPFLVLMVFWTCIYTKRHKSIGRLYATLVLLEECIENYDQVVKQQINT
ncbi:MULTISPECIES: hypothetical protein [Bacillus]|uniref:hypothetical protein n=1 Tax=Bacillus TaxID=1386 RepID=UPI0011A89B9F|nr:MULTISPECIES: hypothetical protein [Bacillus]MCM3045195.1 hypothetical protein [Bacillus altitudinis]MEC1801755.1 hypothetical protein [Bacillus altitudinis]